MVAKHELKEEDGVHAPSIRGPDRWFVEGDVAPMSRWARAEPDEAYTQTKDRRRDT